MAKPIRIQSLARADAILDVLAAGSGAGCRLKDIAAATGLAPSTAATLLESLVGLRQVEKVAGTGRYRLGRRLLQLGRRVEAQVDLLALGRPAIIRLCQASGETANLLVPAATAMIVAESLKGDIILKTSALKGAGLPVLGTASGKCFQAFLGGEMRLALEPELAQVRRLGYATEADEFQPGIVAVAAPILNGAGRILATLSLHGPAERLGPKRLAKLAGLVKQEAKRIAAALP